MRTLYTFNAEGFSSLEICITYMNYSENPDIGKESEGTKFYNFLCTIKFNMPT